MIKETLRQDLESLILEEKTAFLPSTPLNNYAELKKTLVKACGKYKKNSFIFPYPACEVVGKLIDGENTNFKKEFQFFATPQSLAERMANEIIWDKEEVNILEPSAGHGALIDEVLKLNQSVKKNIDAVELSDLNFKTLEEKYGDTINLYNDDFLNFNAGKKYDIIIANPPFNKNQDIDHIRKMFSLLADGGQLITIASSSWTFGSQKKQVEFKEWLENDVVANWVDLEGGEFKSSGTNVKGTFITINN